MLQVPAVVDDKGDGMYVCSYIPIGSGKHELLVTVDQGAVAASPFAVNVRPVVCPAMTLASGAGLSAAVCADTAEFCLQTRARSHVAVAVASISEIAVRIAQIPEMGGSWIDVEDGSCWGGWGGGSDEAGNNENIELLSPKGHGITERDENVAAAIFYDIVQAKLLDPEGPAAWRKSYAASGAEALAPAAQASISGATTGRVERPVNQVEESARQQRRTAFPASTA